MQQQGLSTCYLCDDDDLDCVNWHGRGKRRGCGCSRASRARLSPLPEKKTIAVIHTDSVSASTQKREKNKQSFRKNSHFFWKDRKVNEFSKTPQVYYQARQFTYRKRKNITNISRQKDTDSLVYKAINTPKHRQPCADINETFNLEGKKPKGE